MIEISWPDSCLMPNKKTHWAKAMTAKDILKLIEEVDPSDTAKLDEIDARVWCLIHGQKYGGKNPAGDECFVNGYDGLTPTKARKARKYTRSRDALKSIRPEGWDFRISVWPNELGKGRSYVWADKGKKQFRYSLPTEELVELHAILQAIGYERSQ